MVAGLVVLKTAEAKRLSKLNARDDCWQLKCGVLKRNVETEAKTVSFYTEPEQDESSRCPTAASVQPPRLSALKSPTGGSR